MRQSDGNYIHHRSKLLPFGYFATTYANAHNPRHLLRLNNTSASLFQSIKNDKPFG
jgi:hypothetical protein